MDLANDNTVSIAQKVAFLRQPAAYPHGPDHVEVVETHMAWIFLAGDLAFKMKKPVRYDFLDFTTLSSREFTCREELRLNQRLAGGVYLDVVPLWLAPAGTLALSGAGQVAEWLVKMQRLPAARMLDAAIEGGTVTAPDIAAVAQHLVTFYLTASPVAQSTALVLQRFVGEHEKNVALLSDQRFNLDHALTAKVLARMTRALPTARYLLARRAKKNVFVEGHGDLRPEHVCLVTPPVIIDCLEFNRDLRLLDPFDEIAFLGLECERLGAAWIGQDILAACLSELRPTPTAQLLAFYRAARALLRARLALAHLTEPNPRLPAKWEPRARSYVALAVAALAEFEA